MKQLPPVLRSLKTRSVPINSGLLIHHKAAPVPVALLFSKHAPFPTTTTALPASTSGAGCSTACAEEDCGEKVAYYCCPHEAEIVFAEGSGLAVGTEGVAALDVGGTV